MRKFLLAIAFLLPGLFSCSQELGQLKFTGTSRLDYFTFITDQGVHIRVSPDGKILEWGMEEMSIRSNNYYAPKLQPFMGRIDYYGAESDSVVNGKVKSIGTCWITYYNAYETENAGKIKSIGRNALDYYTRHENAALKGKLRLVGNQVIDYYPSYEDELVRGKLKAIGSTQFIYYNSFDEKFLKGKLKSIGPVNLNYYGIMDRKEIWGVLKGLNRQNINGVTYILR
ncbi:MAG: hypothetical protein H0V30_14015 [Chitinophagaceae bacterium]|jgi:hypothetical protein|nr:hypothetical protein [Chitinophagaceae bacterium]